MGNFCKSVLVTLLTLCCFTSSVFTEQVNHVTQTPAPTPAPKAPVKPPIKPPCKPPTKAPIYPPAKSPTKPVMPSVKPPVSTPKKPPVNPPVYPPKFNRSLIAVQGTVYNKRCTFSGHGTLNDAGPAKGATVRLVCMNKRNTTTETLTDKNGYFLLLGPKAVWNYGYRRCRMYLVKSDNEMWFTVTNLNGGETGAVLRPVTSPEKSVVIVINKLTYGLFNVGPFAFEPTCP